MVSEEIDFFAYFFPVTVGLFVPSQSKVTTASAERGDIEGKIEEALWLPLKDHPRRVSEQLSSASAQS